MALINMTFLEWMFSTNVLLYLIFDNVLELYGPHVSDPEMVLIFVMCTTLEIPQTGLV